jgi:cysteinyl-tRNA synthetase
VIALRELTAILGLFLHPSAAAVGQDDALVGQLMELLIALRKEARADKNFKLGDRIREGLTAAGITLEDRKEGTSWRRA